MEKVDAALASLSKASMMPKNAEIKDSIDWYEDLKFGDHIAVWSPPLGGRLDVGYFHHGVYLGQKAVAHYPRDTNGPRAIRLSEFFNGHKEYYIVRYDEEDRDDISRRLTVTAAQYFVEFPRSIEKYNLLTVNCEYFATFCKTGTATSAQIDILMSVLPVLADGIGQLAAVSFGSCVIS
ncbi:hypothetical protein JKP88DRAFT_284261 [Tribonema minus]|uniref:LRAT domain-containing protein n=1 Tax=Tribonema minus TaxID=303371 RepID=A0A836CP72_9STRA|nr:hypothetical protein JKP88DRAFT_284261 [Tribonema minus]